MKILYATSVPSKKQFKYMKEKLKKSVNATKYGMQESGFKFHHLIMDGIAHNPDNSIYSLVGRPTSIKTHKGIIWKNKKEENKNLFYDHIGYLNIPILKQFIICFSYFFKTLKWLKQNKDEKKCIIMDAAYVTAIPFINLATNIIKCRKVAIVCDIYEYMADVKDARKRSSKLHKLVSKFMSKNYKKIDGFVLLTQQMNNVINPLNKPYIIMEGLVDINMNISKNNLSNKSKRDVIMYAGALREQYGLKNLVEGFSSYSNENAELWIYGAGDYVPIIEEKARIDKRIKFFGIIPNDKIIEKEIEANLLVNPRPINQEFTKYSFPSKNMEYMVSGTPILTTKLPGMPIEYYNYVYLIEGNKAKDITNALDKIFKNSKKDLHEMGKKAKKFVLDNKNNIIQAKNILNLCERIINNENI